MKITSFRTWVTVISITILSSTCFNIAYANMPSKINNMKQTLDSYTLSTPHWYVEGNFGISHLFDKQATGTVASVDENGPGASLIAGYQFNSMLGTELGYTQYYNSRETSNRTIVAKTQHLAVDLAATGRLPLINKLSALGKLGVAYSYAQKMFITTGVAGSSGAVSVYGGLGLDYSLTPTTDFIAQWARAKGNDYTGSSDLYSIGLNFALV